MAAKYTFPPTWGRHGYRYRTPQLDFSTIWNGKILQFPPMAAEIFAEAYSSGNKLLYVSTDGATWTKQANLPAVCTLAAASADCGNLVAIGGGIWTSQTTPAPSVNLMPTNGNLALSWIVPSTNFVLQQSADLSGWADLTNQPVLNLTNLQNEVSLPFSGSNVFFRLKTP